MKPRYTTQDKRVKRSLVTAGRSTRADRRAEVSEARRGGVYRADVEFAPEDSRCGSRVPLTPAQVTTIRELRAIGWSVEQIVAHLQVLSGDVRRVCDKYDMGKIAEEVGK